MPKFIITGGQKLSGEIEVGGAKNNVQIMIAASLLSNETITIKNVPLIDGVEKSLELLRDLGAEVKEGDHQLEINTANLSKTELDQKLLINLELQSCLSDQFLLVWAKLNSLIQAVALLAQLVVRLIYFLADLKHSGRKSLKKKSFIISARKN